MNRLELARRLRISNSRVGDLVEEMLADGLVMEDVAGDSRRGRRGAPVRLRPDYGHFIGFDMEAMRLRLVVVDFAGSVVWQNDCPLEPLKERQALIDRVLGFIDSGLAQARGRFPNLLGIGLAVGGVLDLRGGVIVHYHLIEAAHDIPLRDLVASRTQLPCIMEASLRALTLAEWFGGAGRDLDSFVCLAVRSGVGAGIILRGRLLEGSHGLAGEAGYMVLPTTGGQWRHLQELVSEQALRVDAHAPDAELPESRLRRAGEILGSQVASIAALLDPQAIVLAGGLLRPEGPLWDAVVRAYRQMVLPEMRDRVHLLPARLGPYAAAIGATHRCFQMLFPVETARV